MHLTEMTVKSETPKLLSMVVACDFVRRSSWASRQLTLAPTASKQLAPPKPIQFTNFNAD